MFAVVLAAAAGPQRIVLASPLVDEGTGPDGCTPAMSGFGKPAVWQVRVERFLLDGKALIEAGHIADPNRYPLCIADRPVAKNAEIELPFVAHEGGSAHVAGIVLRFTDPQDFYVVEADEAGGTVSFVSVVNGERREIAAHPIPNVLGSAETLYVKAVGSHFAVALDGKPLFDAQDGSLAAPGRFGVWSRADSDTSFGDLFITTLD